MVLETILYLIAYPPLWHVLIVGLLGAFFTAVVAIWFERKTAARVQRRIGPYWASPRLGGFLNLIADMIRYILQEVIIPRSVDRVPFVLAPVAAFVISIMPMAFVPLSPYEKFWPVPNMDYSLLLALAISTVPPLMSIIGGWASNNKFSIIGSIRESYVITAYELIFVISLLSAAATYTSLNLLTIVNAQSPIAWLLFLNPIAFLAAFLAVLMSTSAFPFEIPESEHEVVGGPYTEYSGILYALNMGGAYVRRFIYAVIMSLVFLGGWAPYVPPADGPLFAIIIPSLIVAIKAVILVLIMSFLRAVYGRYRLDQALDSAWRLVLPMALIGLGWGIVLGLIL
ncbi:MAG: NADH-quinone oxidoreductase subunit NuoH [Acidilobaceae archaeon]|nr:NADH-quinone oxidoreductase subunit NuoH [Acidilobaceae archaeon]MCX8165790.1 NADH-quinone oxidoreductase subunit NuoH [Acidilobaceae archaeon]MDW7974215.1 NADH-quinone oxidoreductase subunit NuoH [Sulfolobales archaeon]